MRELPSIVTIALVLLCCAAAEAAQAQSRVARAAALLAEAEVALTEDRLTAPASDNAFDRFTAVLLLDPGNAAAARGLAQIERRYVELIEQARARGDHAAQTALLQAARTAFPGRAAWRTLAPPAAPTAAASADFRPLPPAPLAARAERVREQLQGIAQEVRERDAAVLIRARSDAEGRWIYSVMRAAVPGYRIRGDIKITSTPAIEFNPPMP